ncbi:MAG: hypothetical protein GX217_05800 [Clostridiaceae bacterium]|jgi:argonaute-like protein implicated in RNA metabolism and viral defense|nr:hypothetical protein [Clostridiaceae bacterium]
MTPKFDNSFDIRDKVIAGLKKENKIQQEIIKEQKILIETLEEQVSELTKLLKDILKSYKKG